MADNYKPDYAVHPGKYLQEILDARQLHPADVAHRSGLSEKRLTQILKQRNYVFGDTARGLQKAVGVAADTWENMSINHL